MSIKELENQKELIDKLIDYENYKELVYLSKQGKLVPFYIIGLLTLTIACRYEYNIPEVLFSMLLAVSMISNITFVILLVKIWLDMKKLKRN